MVTRNYLIEKNGGLIKCILSFFLIFSSLITSAQTLSIEASANKADVLTCETYTYTLKYSCAAGTGNCTNVTMTASALVGMVFPVQSVGLTSDIQSATFSADRRSVTFKFNDPLVAGNTGIVELLAQGECGKPEGTVATLTASIQSGTGTPSTATVNTTLHSTNKFCPYKANGLGLALNNSTYYDVTLSFPGNYGENGIGTTSVTNVVMVDNLPPNAVINGFSFSSDDGQNLITLPSNTCVIDNNPSAPKLTCTFPSQTFEVKYRFAPKTVVRVNVTYPDANFNAGDNVTNSVSINYTPVGGSPMTATNGTSITYQDGATYATRTTKTCASTLNVTDQLQLPTPKLALFKTTAGSITNIRPGDIVLHELRASNTGNVTLNNVVIEDVLPADLRGVSINAFSSVNLTGTETITYWVKTNVQTTYYQVLASDYSYTPPSGEYITHLKVEVSSLPAGGMIQYGGIRLSLAPGSTATSVTNCLTATTATAGTVIDTQYACKTLPVAPLDNFSTIAVSKWLTSMPDNQYGVFYGSPQNIGTTVWSLIRATNMTGGQPLENPVLMDLLPVGLTYDNVIQYGSSSCGFPQANTTEIIPNYNGTGRTLIRLKWNTPLPTGCDTWINIKTKINSLGIGGSVYGNDAAYLPDDAYSQPVGVKNPAFFTGSSDSKCYRADIYTAIPTIATADKFDLDGDGSKVDTLCFALAYVGLTSSAQLESVKWVKGECDTDYTKHPNFGQTMPGGLANYKLIVRNNGNVPATSFEILDMLPYIGDIGVKDVTARLTEWRPNLVTPLNTPTGVTVYYTTAENPCRTDYVASGPAGCNPPNWTTVVPSDPTTVQGLKFSFGDLVLNPGDEVELTWDMRAPVNAPTNGEIAWNSFAFKAIRADNNDPFIPAEPNKVGIKLKAIVPGAYGDKVWIDANKNGIQDNGEVGIDGVRVELHQDNGDGIADPKNDPMVSFTSTANGGLYLFPNLQPSNYFAVFYVPAGYSTTSSNTGSDDSVDSDGVPTICNGQRVTVTAITAIAAAETDLTWDQGVYVDKAALGNYVWFDENQNNIQDESTTNGVNGVIVSLYKDNGDNVAAPDAADGAPIAKDTTATDIYGRPGYYLFENLDPGNYFVKFTLATGQTFTTNTGTVNGSSDQTDSDPTATGVTEVTNLTAGDVDLTWDAGIIIPTGPYNLGNLVWSDVNNNGIVDGTEAGINGVTVILYEDRNNNNKPDSDEYVSTTVTATVGGITGIYKFTSLPAGNYIVQIPDANFATSLKDYISSTGNDPAPDPDDNVENDDNGSPVVGCAIISKPITLGANAEPLDAGVTNYSVDFGFYLCAKPTAIVSVTQPTCTGTNAPNNGALTITGFTTGQRYQYTVGSTFTGTAIPASITAIPAGGVITSTLANTTGSYTVRIYDATDNSCYVDRVVNITAVICCTTPTNNTPTTAAGTCTGSNLNNDATISITGITGDKAAISSAGAATFNGVAYTSATAVSGGNITFSNLQHGASYIIRIYSLTDTCYKDVTVTTPTRTCCPSPNCGTITVIKN